MKFALMDSMVERASGRTVEGGERSEVTELWTFMRARERARHPPVEHRSKRRGAMSPPNWIKQPPARLRPTVSIALRVALMLENVECQPA